LGILLTFEKILAVIFELKETQNLFFQEVMKKWTLRWKFQEQIASKAVFQAMRKDSPSFEKE